MPQQTSQPKGGRKLRRCSRHAHMYAAQFHRTARNKINRLRKRLGYDPTAGEAIKRLQLQRNP